MSTETTEQSAPQAPQEVIQASPQPLSPYDRRKLKLQQDLEDAKLMEQLGQKVIKVKTRVLQRLGEHLEHCGARIVGHGRIVLAGNNADDAFVRCGEYIDKLIAASNPLNGDVIVELFKLQGVFNKQILESGEAHLKADRSLEAHNTGGQMKQAFPAGGTLVVVQSAPQQPSQTLLPPTT